MEELKIEIRERGTFELLSDEIEKIMRREKGEEAVFKEQEKLRESAKKLQGMIDERKIVNEKEKRRILNEVTKEQVSPLCIYIFFSRTSVEIFNFQQFWNNTQDKVEKLKLISSMELEYATEWEKARYEQNLLRCDMEVGKLEKVLNDRRVREKNERRVHAQLTKFLIQETAVSIISAQLS